MIDEHDDIDDAGPLLTHDEPESVFQQKHLARALTWTGLPYETADARVKRYARDRLIHFRRSGTGTTARLYATADIGAACLLSAVNDLGIEGMDAMSAASQALYAWSEHGRERDMLRHRSYRKGPASPVAVALAGVERGETWALRLDMLRDVRDGRRVFDPDLYCGEDQFIGHRRLSDAMAHVAGIVVVCDGHLLAALSVRAEVLRLRGGH